MVEVMFDLNQTITVIIAESYELFQSVIDKCIQKTLLEPDSVYYFVNSKQIEPQQAIEEYMTGLDKQNKKLLVQVNLIEQITPCNEEVIIQSKDIICPECKELCRYTIENFKIKLYYYT